MTPAAYPRVFIRDQLSLPRKERIFVRSCAQRAGPALPSYLALHHAGFSVLLGITTGTVGSYPTFSPLPNVARISASLRFPCAIATVLRSAGGLFSVALSVALPHRAGFNPAPRAKARNSALWRSLRGQPPGVTRRVAHVMSSGWRLRARHPS